MVSLHFLSLGRVKNHFIVIYIHYRKVWQKNPSFPWHVIKLYLLVSLLFWGSGSVKNQFIAIYIPYTEVWQKSVVPRGQWRGSPHSPKLRRYWSLTIRLFSVIYRTLVEGVLPLGRDPDGGFCCLYRLGHPILECGVPLHCNYSQATDQW